MKDGWDVVFIVVVVGLLSAVVGSCRESDLKESVEAAIDTAALEGARYGHRCAVAGYSQDEAIDLVKRVLLKRRARQ